MRNSARQFMKPRPTPRAARIPTVCVVDPQTGDFEGWEFVARENGLRLQIVTNAEEALRYARTHAVDLWVVNVELAGLSGFELCSMLKSRSKHAVVYLVANEYSVEAEQTAWRSRAALFCSKPAHDQWLRQWIDHTSHTLATTDHGESPTNCV